MWFRLEVVNEGTEMICPHCAASNLLGSKICTNCGNKLYEDKPGPRCPVCNAPIHYATRTSPTTLVCGLCFSDLKLVKVSPEHVTRPSVVSEKVTSRIESVKAAYERPTRRIPPQKDYGKPHRPKSRVKQLALFIIVFIIGLMVGYGLGSPGTNQTTTVTLTHITSTTPTFQKETSEAEILTSKEILLKSLNLIPTEYKVLQIAGNLELNLTGFVDGANMCLAKSEELGATKVRIRLYAFNSPSHAVNYAQEEIIQIKEKRGYKDLTSQLKHENCFAWGVESLTASQSSAICTKENYYIFVQVTSTLPLELAKDELTIIMGAIYKNLP